MQASALTCVFVFVIKRVTGWNTQSLDTPHSFLRSRSALSTQRLDGAYVRAWLINYHLLGNLLLGSKQWPHHWQQLTPTILCGRMGMNMWLSSKCMATCRNGFQGFHKNKGVGDWKLNHDLKLWQSVNLVKLLNCSTWLFNFKFYQVKYLSIWINTGLNVYWNVNWRHW